VHTANARAALGPDKLLIPHQAFILDADTTSARTLIRGIFTHGRQEANPYIRNYRRLGYGDNDLADGRSDRLIDALFTWGDEQTVAARLQAHLDAGADHVLLHSLAADLPSTVDQLERLAKHLLS
jgi:probable F420-dependent oxidoreductase